MDKIRTRFGYKSGVFASIGQSVALKLNNFLYAHDYAMVYRTFLEGAQLTRNDNKDYWSVIMENNFEDISSKLITRYIISGMVLLGSGLGPITIGKFTMIEYTDVFRVNDNELKRSSNVNKLYVRNEEDEDTDDGVDSWGVFQYNN